MQKRASRTKSKTPKKYSQPSSRGHSEYRVQMMLMKAVSIFWVYYSWFCLLIFVTLFCHIYYAVHFHSTYIVLSFIRCIIFFISFLQKFFNISFYYSFIFQFYCSEKRSSSQYRNIFSKCHLILQKPLLCS